MCNSLQFQARQNLSMDGEAGKDAPFVAMRILEISNAVVVGVLVFFKIVSLIRWTKLHCLPQIEDYLGSTGRLNGAIYF